MKFTDIFVNRPVLASVISLLIFLIGLRAIGIMELREYPETKSTVVSVTTIYPGADGNLVQSFITEPLQRAVSEADGIDYVTSKSSQGISQIEVHMELNYDPNAAVSEIQAKVASQRSILPREAEDPVIDSRTAQGWALMYISFKSEEMSPVQVTDYLQRSVIPKLQAIPGVAKAAPNGDQSFAMRVWLNPERMAALGVTAADVRNAIQQNNFLAGVGQTESDYVTVNLGATTNVSDEEAFRDMIVRSDPESLVRLRDVAEVELADRNENLVTWFNGEPSILLAIETAPGANPLTVARDVHAALPDIKRQVPSSMSVEIGHDGSEFIERSINEVFRTIGEAVLIVLLVIFLSLGSWHAAIVPAVSVPLSLVGGAFLMLAFGFSINLLTLLAMLLAIGLVVDDAIVVVENVHRHILDGKSALIAARDGARELGMPIISMTTTLLAVYAPIGFMGGLAGVLFSEFAFTLAGAVLISGVVALTLCPMLSAKVLASSAEPKGFELRVEHFFERLANRYRRSLSNALNYQPANLLFAVGILTVIPFLFMTSKSEMAPTEDREVLNIQALAPETATIEYAETYAKYMVDRFNSFPEYARSFIMVGGGGTPATTFGGFRMTPIAERDRTQHEVQPILQAELNKVAGLQIGVFTFPALPGTPVGPPVQFVITTDQAYEQLDALADELIGEAAKTGQFAYLAKSTKFALPRTNVVIDRDRAGDLGIDMSDIGVSLATFLGGNNVNRFSLEGRSYEVIPQVSRFYRSSYDWIDSYYVRAASGDLVPLSSVVKFEHEVEPTQRTQFQQLNSLTINAVMFPGTTLGQALDFMETTADRIFPREFSYDYIGASRQFVEQGSALVLTFFLSILIIYLVLAAQFESWRDPLIILVSVPMSIAGALVFVSLGMATINIYTQVGLITLIGLIAKNGILIVDFANKLQDEDGLSAREAVERAAGIRLRPILMTTVAMLMAVVPLLLATGPGSVSRFQIGLVIVTGLGIGTLFTLYIVPSFYLFLSKRRKITPDASGEAEPASAPLPQSTT